MFRAWGHVVYDPPRPTMKRRNTWWCVIEVSESIGFYYRWWVKRALHIELHRPPHTAHVTVIRGEQPPEHLRHLWRKYQGRRVEFWYDHNVRQSGDTTDRPTHHWFVNVRCPMIDVIRGEFGFISTPDYPHLTIGRTYAVDGSRLAA